MQIDLPALFTPLCLIRIIQILVPISLKSSRGFAARESYTRVIKELGGDLLLFGPK